jgi:uncharacterized membrane protein YraQ (UPF0718 family)
MESDMKRFIKKNKWDILISGAFFIFIAMSYFFDYSKGKEITLNFKMFLIEMMSFIPLMFILIGLFDVWFPKEKVEKQIGVDSGVKGIIWVILLAMLQAGPLYGAFPVAYLLWKKGGSIRNIFIYLGAFATLKIPMLMFEIGFMGVKFSLIRTLITLPLFIIIGFIMEWYLKDKKFQVTRP